jgi:hypothetical protein
VGYAPPLGAWHRGVRRRVPTLKDELRPLFAGRKVVLTGGRWRR